MNWYELNSIIPVLLQTKSPASIWFHVSCLLYCINKIHLLTWQLSVLLFCNCLCSCLCPTLSSINTLSLEASYKRYTQKLKSKVAVKLKLWYYEQSCCRNKIMMWCLFRRLWLTIWLISRFGNGVLYTSFIIVDCLALWYTLLHKYIT